MSSGLDYRNFHKIKKAVTRALMIVCLATTLATTFVAVSEPQPVYAASTTVRHDRRPDRERPVTTSQGSSNSGYSQNSSSSNSRPRLVRR